MSHLHHKVSALIDGELSESSRARALAHARGCAQCRREIAETLEVKQRLTQLAATDVSIDLLDLVAPLGREPGEAGGGVGPALRRVLVSVGSMSMVVVALAYAVGAPEVSQAAPVNPPVKEFTAEFADSTGLVPLADPPVDAFADSSSASTAPISFGTFRQRRGVPTSVAPASGSGDQLAAVDLLRQAALAPDRVAFRGMRVVRSFVPAGVEQFAVEVHHVPGQGTMFDVRNQSDSGAATFVADGDPGDEALEGKPVGALVAAYDVALDGSQSILGRQATVITASRGGQVSARFWVDDATGLLLRREMYVGGRLVRWSGFTSIATSPHGFMPHLPPEVAVLPTTPLSTTLTSALNDKGWVCPARLAGDFRLSFLRQVDTAGAIMHAEYTDGLSTVSVFEERGSLDASALDGYRRLSVAGNALYLHDGLPMVAVWQSGDKVFTVVTDLPQQLSGPMLSRFPHLATPAASGVSTRIGTGLSRLVSAVAP